MEIENSDSRRLDWEVAASGVDTELKKMILEEVMSNAGRDDKNEQEPMPPIVPKELESGESSANPDASEQQHDLEHGTTPDSNVRCNKEAHLRALKTTAEVVIAMKKKRSKDQSKRELSDKEIRARLKKKTRSQARRRRMMKGRKAGAKQKLKEKTKRDMQESVWG